MRRFPVLGIAALSVAVLAAVAVAQTTVQPVAEDAVVETTPLAGQTPLEATANAAEELKTTQWGDPNNGAMLAGACAACHGLDGNAMQQNAPRIAGQGELYIARQLAAFKSGERHENLAAIMAPFAQPLSAQDMRDLGAHYSRQASGAGVADDSIIADTGTDYDGLKFYQVGERLYRQGDAARNIPACLACHGPSGHGNPGAGYPHLSGQTASYVAQRLELYRAGTTSRKDPSQFNIMANLSQQLTDLEIASLGNYLQGLHTRPDSATAQQLAAAGSAAPAADAAPMTDAAADAPAADTSSTQ